MALGPVIWEALERLRFDVDRHRLHAAGCPAAHGIDVARGERLELMRAPELCWRCRPQVAMPLGAQRVD